MESRHPTLSKRESKSPKLSKRDFESLYKYILSATDRNEVTWYFNFDTYTRSLDTFKKAVITESCLWDVLEVDFKDLPMFTSEFKDKQFVGGWDRAVFKWRLQVGR